MPSDLLHTELLSLVQANWYIKKVLQTNIKADVELVQQCWLAAATKSNDREKRRQVAYDYKAGDKGIDFF